MAKTKTGSKPLLFPTDTPDTEKLHLADPFAYAERTPDYIPGYGEIVMANDIERGLMTAEQKRSVYQQIGSEPMELPVEFAWVRVSSPGGGYSYNANVDAADWSRRGYRPCSKEDFDALKDRIPGLRDCPVAHVEADGSIRREDTALWVNDGERARAYDAWLAAKHRALEEPMEAAGQNTGVPITVTEEERGTVTVTS